MKYFIAFVCTLLFAIPFNTSEAPASDKAPAHHALQVQALASEASPSNDDSDDDHLPSDFESTLHGHIHQWITTLAAEDEFASWHNVIWETHPLGPGMHSWLVLIYSATSLAERGYLVIGATPEGGLELVEYGLGDYPLFSLTTLQQAFNEHDPMHQDKLVKASRHVYYDPMQAVWQLPDMTYIDAVTAEIYYLDEDILAIPPSDNSLPLITSSAQLMTAETAPLFDPYEQINWVFDEPLHVDEHQQLFAELTDAIKQSRRMTYVASVFADNILIPLAVIGYHVWDDGTNGANGTPYIKLDQHSSRFIPLSTLLLNGAFYLN